MNYSLLRSIMHSPWMVSSQTAAALAPVLRGVMMGLEMQQEDPIEDSMVEVHGQDGASIIGNVHLTYISGTMLKHDTGCGIYGMRTLADRLVEYDAKDEVLAHVICIESGGGAANSVPEIADGIMACSKPVVAFIDGIACSAAIYAASYCSRIFAGRGTDIVGSVGTLITLEDFPKWAKEETGLVHARIYADGSEDKNGEYEQALEGKFELIREKTLNPLAEQFRADMKRNRPGCTDDQLKGADYKASEVIGSFVDEIGSLQAAVSYAAQEGLRRRQAASGQSSEETHQTNSNMEITNLHSVAGLEELRCDTDGCLTLNQDQIALVEQALAERTQAAQTGDASLQEAQARIAELEQLNGNQAQEIDRLSAALEQANSDGAAAGTAQAQMPEGKGQVSAADICRAHIAKYHN